MCHEEWAQEGNLHPPNLSLSPPYASAFAFWEIAMSCFSSPCYMTEPQANIQLEEYMQCVLGEERQGGIPACSRQNSLPCSSLITPVTHGMGTHPEHNVKHQPQCLLFLQPNTPSKEYNTKDIPPSTWNGQGQRHGEGRQISS